VDDDRDKLYFGLLLDFLALGLLSEGRLIKILGIVVPIKRISI